jgi:hypothetical protein
VRALAGSDGGGPSRYLRSAQLCAQRDQTAGLLLDRHAAQPRLQAQPLGNFVIEIADDDRGHDS